MLSTRHRRYGFTLIELIMALTITALLCAVFFLLIYTGTRLWYLCSAHAQSYPDAAIILHRITQDLKCAANNNISFSNNYPPSTHARTSYTDANGDTLYDSITFQIPLQANDVLNSASGHYHMLPNVDVFPSSGTLQPGTQISYYPMRLATHANGDGIACDTNHDGVLDNNEHWDYAIYRQVSNPTTNQVYQTEEVANNAQLPTFCQYGQTTGRVFTVYASVITLEGYQGATSYTSSYSTTIDVRNSEIPYTSQ